MAPRTAVVGVGNSLMQDDGVGVHVARALSETSLPEGVAVIDAGTDPDVAFDLGGVDRVIVIDATRGGEAPGTVYRFPASDGVGAEGGRRACHDVGFLQTLRDVAAAGDAPQVVIIGVEPKVIDWGLDLSPAVAASVPRAIEVVRQELRRSDRRT